MSNYVKENSICLPGRKPGFKNDDIIKVLSSFESKMSVWRVYDAMWETSYMWAVSCRKFLQLWESSIQMYLLQNQWLRSVWPVNRIPANIKELQTSLTGKSWNVLRPIKITWTVLRLREYYKNSCTNYEKALEIIGSETLLNHKSHDAYSLNATVHYSFNYAQQVHIPSNPMQPGPIYFKTPRKCWIFVMCKGESEFPHRWNHFHWQRGVHDNKLCSLSFSMPWIGRNKSYLLWYMARWTLIERHYSITYSFLIARNTKFGLGHSYRIIKKSRRHTVMYVSSLYKFARLVETSSITGINKTQLVGTHNRREIVPV